MSRFKGFALASCVGLFGAALAPNVYADQWNKRTILTVNESIQIPNKVLTPGKYVMKLLDSPSNRHIVQIFDENEQHLVTTVLAIPNYRLQPTGDTSFGWWEVPAGQPKALRSWFYPGDNFGQEFAYPKNEAMKIASVVNQPVPTTYAQSEADLTTARVGTVDQVGTERELDRGTYSDNNQTKTAQSTDMPVGTVARETPRQTATQTPTQTAQDSSMQRQTTTDMAQARRTPAATPSTDDQNTADRAATPQSLPHTASAYPLAALIGLLSLVAFGVVTFAAKRA